MLRRATNSETLVSYDNFDGSIDLSIRILDTGIGREVRAKTIKLVANLVFRSIAQHPLNKGHAAITESVEI